MPSASNLATSALPRPGPAATDQKKRLSTIRWTHHDYSIVQQRASDAGLSFGGYLRCLALGSPGPRAVRRPPIERRELARLLGEIGKLGSNVNQIAHIANTLRTPPPGDVLAGLAADVASMRAAILSRLVREA